MTSYFSRGFALASVLVLFAVTGYQAPASDFYDDALTCQGKVHQMHSAPGGVQDKKKDDCCKRKPAPKKGCGCGCGNAQGGCCGGNNCEKPAEKKKTAAVDSEATCCGEECASNCETPPAEGCYLPSQE